MNRKRWIVTSLLTLLVASAIPGEAQSGIIVADLNGKQTNLEALIGGKATMIVLWATWCGYCTQQIPNVKKAKALYEKDGLNIVAVNPGIRDSFTRFRQFVAQRKIDYPVFFDPTGKVAAHFEVTGVPMIILYDEDGNEISNSDHVEFDKIEQLLKN
jgi:thiol-disulfide isomerase/thioredoxin